MKMFRTMLLAGLAVGALALSACSQPAAANEGLEGTNWLVVTYDSDGNATEVLTGSRPGVEFSEDGNVYGKLGCNSFFGPYTIDGVKVSMGPLGSTQMYCAPDELMAQEYALSQNLENVATFKVEGDKLTLTDEAGAVVMELTRG